jgi:hypothetical protein
MCLCTLPGSSARPEPVENTTSTGASSAARVVSVVSVVSVNLQGGGYDDAKPSKSQPLMRWMDLRMMLLTMIMRMTFYIIHSTII